VTTPASTGGGNGSGSTILRALLERETQWERPSLARHPEIHSDLLGRLDVPFAADKETEDPGALNAQRLPTARAVDAAADDLLADHVGERRPGFRRG